MALLEVSGLVKYFGSRRVVNGVSFNVNAGEVVGLLGPNGAGKTTSFRMATGQIPPNDGKVTFNGEDVTGLPMYQRARRGMGYLSQEPSVFRKLTVEKNLLAILEALPRSRSLRRRLTRRERWERTNDALRRFKLEHVRRVFRSADRVYLISEGQVVTHGTPHELVNDQKAIDAYLGRSFEEDGFTRHFAARSHARPTGASPAGENLPFGDPLPEPGPAG